MGLDFSHGGARWSYGGFNRFRVRLAKEIGWTSLAKAFEDPFRNARYSDDGFENHPLKDFLMHSDCDGELSAEQCLRMCKPLRDAVSAWPDDDFDKQQALKLADGMESAGGEGEPLEFC